MNNEIAPFPTERLTAAAHKLRTLLLIGLAMLAELFDGTPLGAALRVRVLWLLSDLELLMKARLYLVSALDAPRVRRCDLPPLPPFRAPKGVRRQQQRGSALRHVTRGLFPPAGITARIARLRHVMRHPERAMAQIRARVVRGLINGRLVLRAVARCVVCDLARVTPKCADTS